MKNRFQKKHIQFLILGIFVVLDIFIWVAAVRADRRGELTVAFLDVGQGDAIYIEAPNGNQMLIDGGPAANVLLRDLSHVMPFYDHSIDLVLATHPDQDHVGGLPAVLERMNVSGVVTTENSAKTGAYSAFEKIIQQKNIRHVLAKRGERFILDDGVVFEIIFPDHNVRGWETNMGSIVAKLSYGSESFLFTGDSPQPIEKYLVAKDGGALHANILKLGHHGSKTSSSREFLSAVNPDEAIISAGLNNRYGHPHKEVLDLLAALKIPSVSTIDHGTIVFKTDGDQTEME